MNLNDQLSQKFEIFDMRQPLRCVDDQELVSAYHHDSRIKLRSPNMVISIFSGFHSLVFPIKLCQEKIWSNVVLVQTCLFSLCSICCCQQNFKHRTFFSFPWLRIFFDDLCYHRWTLDNHHYFRYVLSFCTSDLYYNLLTTI